jgi:flagellar hook-associated protein 2
VPISFSGLASGLDTTAIITALTASAKIPMSQIQTQQATLTSKSKKITDIKTDLTSMQTAAKALDTKTKALGNKVSTSDEKVLKATAKGGSSMGTFKIDVKSLAQPERTYSNAFTSDDEANAAGAGTLSIKLGTGDAIDVAIDTADTLATIATKINKSGAGVSAGVFHDGEKFRLQITGTKSGSANAIEFTESQGLSLGLTDAANEKQTATDAEVEVDGFTIKSSTNDVNGAVPGVTLNLVEKGVATVKVDRDSDGMKTKIDAFMKSYNDVMRTLNTEFSSTGTTKKAADSLSGDSTLRALQTSMRSIASKVISNGDSAYTTLASIGITTARDGQLTMDTTKYNAAVSADYEGVSTLLAGRTEGTGVMANFTEGIEKYVSSDGTLSAKVKSYTTQSANYTKQIAGMQTRLDKYTETLNAQYSALEQTMSSLKSQGSSLSAMLSSST